MSGAALTPLACLVVWTLSSSKDRLSWGLPVCLLSCLKEYNWFCENLFIMCCWKLSFSVQSKAGSFSSQRTICPQTTSPRSSDIITQLYRCGISHKAWAAYLCLHDTGFDKEHYKKLYLCFPDIISRFSFSLMNPQKLILSCNSKPALYLTCIHY